MIKWSEPKVNGTRKPEFGFSAVAIHCRGLQLSSPHLPSPKTGEDVTLPESACWWWWCSVPAAAEDGALLLRGLPGDRSLAAAARLPGWLELRRSAVRRQGGLLCVRERQPYGDQMLQASLPYFPGQCRLVRQEAVRAAHPPGALCYRLLLTADDLPQPPSVYPAPTTGAERAGAPQ